MQAGVRAARSTPRISSEKYSPWIPAAAADGVGTAADQLRAAACACNAAGSRRAARARGTSGVTELELLRCGKRKQSKPAPAAPRLNRRCHTLSASAAIYPSRRQVNVFTKSSQRSLCVSNSHCLKQT